MPDFGDPLDQGLSIFYSKSVALRLPLVFDQQPTAFVFACATGEREPVGTIAARLLRLSLERYATGKDDDTWTLEPLYLRPSAAEEQRHARSS